MRTMLMVAGLVMGACGGGDPSSCAQAARHFYGAGCAFHDAGGAQYTEGEFVTSCHRAEVQEVSICLDEFDVYLSCLGDIKSPATVDADCDCSSEQDDWLRCK